MTKPGSNEHMKSVPATTSPESSNPQDALRRAMEWQVLLWSGEATRQEEDAFRHWCQASPEHRQAWQRVQRVNQQLEQVERPLASGVLRKSALQQTRRRALLMLGLACGAGLTGYRFNDNLRALTADYRTGIGERYSMQLPDGSRLILNTDTAVSLHFTAQMRGLRLIRGEVLIVTAPDSHAVKRPFLVSTDAGHIRPIGTEFTVRRLSHGRTQVQVLVGAVELRPAAGDLQRLEAGQQTRFDSHLAEPPRPLPDTATAWQRNLLVVERERLGDVVAELNRYHPGILRCDPAVAHLILSGVYPLDDLEAILRALTQALPIRIDRLTRYWISLTEA